MTIPDPPVAISHKGTKRGKPQPNSHDEKHEEHEEEPSIWSFSKLRVLRALRGEESFSYSPGKHSPANGFLSCSLCSFVAIRNAFFPFPSAGFPL
jgi:hypothetical protein